MWGNDFPHPEGTWPHTTEWLRSAFSDVPEDETRQMLGTTAATVYNFDVDALAPPPLPFVSILPMPIPPPSTTTSSAKTVPLFMTVSVRFTGTTARN